MQADSLAQPQRVVAVASPVPVPVIRVVPKPPPPAAVMLQRAQQEERYPGTTSKASPPVRIGGQQMFSQAASSASSAAGGGELLFAPPLAIRQLDEHEEEEAEDAPFWKLRKLWTGRGTSRSATKHFIQRMRTEYEAHLQRFPFLQEISANLVLCRWLQSTGISEFFSLQKIAEMPPGEWSRFGLAAGDTSIRSPDNDDDTFMGIHGTSSYSFVAILQHGISDCGQEIGVSCYPAALGPDACAYYTSAIRLEAHLPYFFSFVLELSSRRADASRWRTASRSQERRIPARSVHVTAAFIRWEDARGLQPGVWLDRAPFDGNLLGALNTWPHSFAFSSTTPPSYQSFDIQRGEGGVGRFPMPEVAGLPLPPWLQLLCDGARPLALGAPSASSILKAASEGTPLHQGRQPPIPVIPAASMAPMTPRMVVRPLAVPSARSSATVAAALQETPMTPMHQTVTPLMAGVDLSSSSVAPSRGHRRGRRAGAEVQARQLMAEVGDISERGSTVRRRLQLAQDLVDTVRALTGSLEEGDDVEPSASLLRDQPRS